MSVRLQVTLWNVFFLACLLLGMGLALRWTLQVSLMSAIDREVVSMARHEQEVVALPRMFMPPPPPAFMAMRPDKDSPFSRFTDRSWDVHGNPTHPQDTAAPYRPVLYRLALVGNESLVTTEVNGERTRLLYVPLRRHSHIVGVAQISGSLADMDREIRELTGVLLLLVGPGLVIAGLGGALLTNRALLPVRRITEAAGRMEAEDLSRRFPVNGRDELSTLSFTFNGMLARLEKAFHEQEEASAELERANRHLKQVNELQRRFTGDASHELKTPLTVIQGTVSLTLSSPRTQKQYEQALHTVGHAADTMIKIVRDLLLLARSDAGLLEMNKHRAKLWEIVQVAAESVATAEPSAKINILVDHDIAIVCDPDHLTRLFMNLMDNAQRYTPADGSITVAAQRQEGSLSVTVADTGSGIPPEHLAHVFDRFYRVDAARSDAEGGTGLGLAICRSIVEAHGGSISISSKLGHGTLVEMRFPL